MAEIHVLDKQTIDQIAAGEVVERPSSVVKELTENAVDAGASAVTVEIRDGGISLIRVTDNGSGIPADQVKKAFFAHATSKLSTIEDLSAIRSFGFRGEALSSIAAVAKVELITKTPDAISGTRYLIEGGEEKSLEEIGAPDGSTFLVRDLFFNTPPRKKFLKSSQTEAGYIADFCMRFALSNPNVSVKFVSNGQLKFHTSGSGREKDVIFAAFGREASDNLIPIDETSPDGKMHVKGFLGKPVLSRGNRAMEIFFVNGRLVGNRVLSRALEEGYATFLMQHRFPFSVLNFQIDGGLVDVNVHPAKAEVRFSDEKAVYEFILNASRGALTHRELVIHTTFDSEKEENRQRREEEKAAADALRQIDAPEPFEQKRMESTAGDASAANKYAQGHSGSTQPGTTQSGGSQAASSWRSIAARDSVRASYVREESSPYGRMYPQRQDETVPERNSRAIADAAHMQASGADQAHMPNDSAYGQVPPPSAPNPFVTDIPQTGEQMSLFRNEEGAESGAEDGAKDRAEEKACTDTMLLSPEHQKEHRLVGQIFDTYWIIELDRTMYIVDQHAAHEKVMYERLRKRFLEKQPASQQVSPPIIVHLTMQETNILETYEKTFESIGFSISSFGGNDAAISAVPQDLFGLTPEGFFRDMLDSLGSERGHIPEEAVIARVATMACKAAVKGNTRLTFQEADALISEMLTLDNPWNCPHGRPTVISMEKAEIEKKFRRIV